MIDVLRPKPGGNFPAVIPPGTGYAEERILILAPTGNDARLTAEFVKSSGLPSAICRDVTDLCDQMSGGCGAILLAEETLEMVSISHLVEALARQPPWSDIPLTIVTSGGEASQTRLRRLTLFGPAGNVTLLERPFRQGTLISTLEVALRSRRRQYEVRNLMAALSDAQARMEATLEAADVGTWVWDIRQDRVVADRNLARLFSLAAEDFVEGPVQRFIDGIHPEDRSRVEAAIKTALADGGDELEVDYRLPQPDRSVRWVTARGKVERDALGHPIRFPGVVIDITERKQQQDSLLFLARKIEEQARVFNITLSHIHDFAYIFDRAGRFLYANKPLLDLWGLTLDQAVGKNFLELRYPDELATRLQRQIQHVFDTREVVRDETSYTNPAGEPGFYEYIFNPVLAPDGTVEMVAGSTRDVTERKRHEAELARLVCEQEAQARLFDTTLSSITDLAYTFDLEGNWIYANRPLLELWGKTLSEITGRSSLDLGYPPELAERLRQQVRQVVATGKPVRGETYFTDAAGQEDYHEYIFSPVLGDNGQVTAVCGTTRLMTERKRAEAVAESQRRVLQLMAEDQPLPEILEALLHTVELECSNKTFASVMLLDPDGIHLRFGAAPHLPPAFVRTIDGIAIGPAVGSSGTAAYTKRPVYVSDIATDPLWENYRHLALAHGLRACWAIPILSSQGNVLGTFAIYHPEPRQAGFRDLRVVEVATRTASIAIERKVGDAAMRESRERYSQLVHALPTALYTTDAQGRITLYNEAAATLWGRKPDVGQTLWCGSTAMYRPDGTALSADQSPLAVTLREGRPVRGEEIIIERPDGTRRLVAPFPDPIRDAAGRIVGGVTMLLDVTDSKGAEAASRRLAAIVESSDDAIISKDLNGIITSWNRGAEYLFGYRPQEIIGKSVTTLMPPEQLNEEPQILNRIRRGDRIVHYETIRQHKDGSRLEVSLTVSPIRDSAGAIIGASKIIRDITAQKQAERKLESAHREAVAASRAKDEFLAALSHELRTPLNPALLLASEAAEDALLPEPVRAQFATIRNHVELEARLIDDLLDITRITHGKLSLDLGPVDVGAVLLEAIGTIQSDVHQKRITLTVSLAATTTTVRGDAVRLQQVFWNVLKNAVKFTPEGGRIDVSSRIGGGELIVTVADSGIGMSREDLAKIFEAFTQGEHVSTGGAHRFGGLGLGLAITRKLVESHAGTITATSRGLKQGATFVITLPLGSEGTEVNPANGGSVSAPPKAPAGRTEPIRILLVEDHEPTRTALSHLLARRRYEVTTAASLAEARTLFERQEFPLLISDIGLPDGNGFELMKELRARKPDLQGIALTGYGMEQDVARGQAAGFQVHLTKPVRVQSLDSALATVVSQLR